MTTIPNYNSKMQYRRFGKSEAMVSAITLGGMRYTHCWDKPRYEIPEEMITNCCECIERALDSGINLIETAYGYVKSEKCYGIALNERLNIPRDSYYLMTKGGAGIPENDRSMRHMVEEQLEMLQTDYIDFYGFHGLNNKERLEAACRKGGPVEELLALKEEGIIKSVGFSTHGPLEVIEEAIKTDMFDFVNLHYYYFFQHNRPAVDLAAEKDMGVFIISPNDKGGKLYEPPQLLRDICAPATPIQWNARFTLSTPQVQTLSFGMTESSHFDEMIGIFSEEVLWDEADQITHSSLEQRLDLDIYSRFDAYAHNLHKLSINIPEILRFRTLWKCFEMNTFVKYRYNMLQAKGHWFPGSYATDENIDQLDDSLLPKDIPVKEMLREVHQNFYEEKEK